MIIAGAGSTERSLESALLISYRFIYETERYNGTAELLEILGR